MNYCSLLLLSVWILTVASENIIIIHSFWVGSHLFTMRSIADLYVEMGHNVTILRYLDQGSPGRLQKKGINEILMTLNNTDARIPYVSQSEHGRFTLPHAHLWKNGLGLFMIPPKAFLTETMICDDFLSRKPLMSQLKEANFSLALVDITFNECGLAYAYNLGLPVVGYLPHVVTSGPILYTAQFIPPSMVPMLFSGLPDNMTFLQRVSNTFTGIFYHSLMQVIFFFINSVVQKHYPGTPGPPELLRDMSGFYWDSHPAIEYPRPLLPTFGYIGGLHLKEPMPLPNDLERFVESSGDDGFILFSLGISFSPDSMPAEKFQSYFEAFSTMKQKVIVASKGSPSWVPENVRVFPSVPQRDLLAHSKISLFVGHGGIKGVMESLHFGVPMVGIPVFSDQEGNMLRLEELGAAKVIRKEDSKQAFVEAMNEVMDEPRYRENARRISNLMKLHKSPKETAASIFNLVLKTKGAEFLKMPARKLNMFQYLCMDLALFFMVASVLILLTLYYSAVVGTKYLQWYIARSHNEVKKNC